MNPKKKIYFILLNKSREKKIEATQPMRRGKMKRNASI